MPQVIITQGAADGLEHCRLFLSDKNPLAAKRAGKVIATQFTLLETTLDIGRPLNELPDIRELNITFGDSGYVALYRHIPENDIVYILVFRHQKEAGY